MARASRWRKIPDRRPLARTKRVKTKRVKTKRINPTSRIIAIAVIDSAIHRNGGDATIRHEPVAHVYFAPDRNLPGDGGDRFGRARRISFFADRAVAGSRLSDHSGPNALSGRKP